MALPREAETVIIGAGAVGCAVAYHMAQAGKSDILILEKGGGIAVETSAQAAGLVGQVRDTVERTRLAMWSVNTFRKLQEDLDAPPSWREVGSLRVALNEERASRFEQLRDISERAGLQVEMIDASRAKVLCPAIELSRATAILWCPTDGYLQPSDLAMAYYVHSRREGVVYCMRTRAHDIRLNNDCVEAVVTDQDTVHCKTVINAAGAHAYHIAKLVGLQLPIVPVRHEFLVSVEAPGMRPNLPVVRIPDGRLYMRAETDSLLLGGWEPHAMAQDPQSYPLENNPPRIEEDWETLGLFVENLGPYFPPVNDLGIRSVFKGWPTFTPDGHFIIGESCCIRGFVMAGGCNAHGVSGSAGIGKHVVDSMLEDHPSEYVRSLSPDRFTEHDWDWNQAMSQARRIYETYYA